MNPIIYPFLATLFLSLTSLVSVVFLPIKKFQKALPFIVALAAGTMIGDSFLHIIPHAIEESNGTFEPSMLVWIIVGIIIFYLLETIFSWHHHHNVEDNQKPHHIAKIALIGDGLHNFFDGLGIALAFSVSPTLGVITTIAYILHEIPQEIGDFAIYLASGYTKTKALLYNFLSGLTALIGCFAGVFLANSFENLQLPLVLISAGSLIYIALVDLVPESNSQNMHKHKSFRFLIFATFIVGVALMYGLIGVETILGLE